MWDENKFKQLRKQIGGKYKELEELERQFDNFIWSFEETFKNVQEEYNEKVLEMMDFVDHSIKHLEASQFGSSNTEDVLNFLKGLDLYTSYSEVEAEQLSVDGWVTEQLFDY